MTTYLLIQAEAGRVDEAAAILRSVAAADAIDIVQGPFDIIARAEDPDSEGALTDRCAAPPFIRVLPCRSAATS